MYDLKILHECDKGSKLEVKKFCRLSLTFVEITGEKLVAGGVKKCTKRFQFLSWY